MTRSARVLQVLSFLLIAAGSLTCSGDKLVLPDEGDPSAVSVVAGNNQTGTVGIVLTDSIMVQVTDSKARPVVAARVQFILGTNGTGGDLIPDTAVTDADGRARARWVLGTKAGVQLATARVVGFTRVSTSINATAQADVADTVFVLSGDGQTGPVGQALAESLVVRVNDQFGNPVSAISVGWSVSGGGSVSPATVATGPNGQAAVQRVLGPSAGAQSAAATVAGVNGSPVGFIHNAVAGGPTALLKIDGDLQTAPAGTFLAESLQVQLVDGSGNGVAGRQIAFAPSPNNGTASPTSVVTDANGFASSRWTLGGTAGSQSLIASGAGFPVTFTATATSDVPTQMAIVAGNNQTTTAGTAVLVDPSVRVRDVGGNNVPNVSVTFTVTGGGGTVAGPSGSGTSTIVATDANGLATLTSWTLGGIAGPNTMSATASGPSGPLTGSPLLFTSTGNAGPPDHLSITTQPPTTVASGSAFGTTPVIQVRDAGGNPINQANINVTVSLASGSGILNGTKTQPTNSSGQATFSGLSITGLVGPYTLDFNSGSLTGATSSTINLTPGAANKLFLTTQPSSSAQSGVPFVQQPVVQIVDAAGNSVSQSGTPIDVLIATGGGSLTGTHPVNTDASGTATFTDLAISGAAGGRTLDFNATGLTKATSTVVTIGAGGATKLGFGAQPTNTQAGSAISPAVTVLVQDGSGNTVSGATNAVTVALLNNPSGANLSGTLTVNAVNGVATFSDLSLDKVGTGYTLTATATGLSAATSTGFNITPGSATQLVFTQQPSNVVAGSNIAPPVTVTVQDAMGNTVTGYGTAISMALGNNPGTGTLTGGAAVTPVNGVATFSGLSINRTGNGYTLVASSGTLNQISTAFNVSPGAASQLVFIQQPSNSVAGSSIAPPVQVAVEDALGNTLTSATTPITLAIGNNPPGNGVLTGGGPVSAVAGIATFSNLKIDKPGTGYTLTANGGGLPTRTSASFDISVGSGNKLVFIVQPSNAVVGQANTPAIQVQIRDAADNPVGGTDQITLVSSGPPVSGNVVNAVNGIATFNNLKVNGAATGVTLTALASGLLSATSASFDVTPATTTTIITSDLPDPSVTGRSITVNYTVAVNAPGSGTATGTVTVTDGTVNCQSTVSAGSCQLAPTTAGAKTITATYSGNADFSGSTSAVVSHQVNPASTATLITSDLPEPSVVGQPVTVMFTVTVNAPGNGTPTGNVTISAGADTAIVPVSAGQGDLVLTSPGSKTIVARYMGDGNFNPSQDSDPHTVNKAASTVTITSDLPDPSGAGEAVTVGFTVVASAPGAGTPTGNVVVTVSGSGDTCTGTVAAGSCSLVITTVGANKTITATYAGDANFLTGSDTELHDVNAGGTTTTITSTTPSASVVGQPVVIHYSVTPTSGGTPTGTVSVTDGAQSCNATVAAGQCSITFNGAGARTLVATYGGDANFSGSVSAGFGQQVNTASTTTSITADTPNPSTVGQAYTVSYSVGVVAPGGGTPTGSVIVSDGTDTCTGTVAAGGCGLTSTTTGSKNLVATYQGDGDYTGSASAPAAHLVNPAGTTTVITSDSPDPSSIGQAVAVDFSVTVDAPGSGTPTGNVTVSDGTDTCVGTVAAGTCSITLNTSGSRPLTATYAGNADFNGSVSAAEPHVVGVTGTTTSITGHTPDPSVVGQPVSVSVTVTGGSTPTGTVTVSDGSTNCIATLAGGSGSCNITLGTAGTRTLTGTYSGDGSHGGSTSPGVGQTVNQASTSTAITSDSPDPSSIGQAVAVDFSVTVDAPGSGTPTGNVTVSDGTDTCVGTVAAGTCNITLNTVGSRPLTATYAGDANFNGSASAAEPHSVALTGTTTTITSHTPSPSVVGQQITVDFTVSGGIGTPTGTVTVSDGTINCNATLSGGSGSCNLTFTSAGTRTLTADYGGDITHGGSTSPGVSHQVNASPTTTTITSHTPDPSVVGQTITVDYTVTAAAPGSGTPVGNVDVSDGTDGCTATVAAGTCQFIATTAGTKTITATYVGNANFATSSDNASHQVNAFGPADPASSTGNVPNGTPGVATIITVQAKDQFGNNVTVGGENVVVTVSGANSAGPTTATDNGDGTYTATYTPTNSGPDQVDITMNGTPISGSPFNTTVAVAPAFQMQLFAGDNQSAPVGSQVPVNPSVLVLDSQNNPVSGLTITFAIGSGGGSLSGGNTTTNSSGIADVGWTLGTAAGSNTLTATRTGLQGSPVVFSATATPGSTVTTITSDSPDPSAIGQAVTVDFSVAVSAPASGTPGGDVTVSDGVNSCVAPVAAGSCNVALLTLGSRPLTASYAGDANFTGSTSGPAAHTVDLLASTTTITSHTPSPSVVGELVVVNVTVTGGLTPTGTVTVSDGTDSCVATLSGGSGSCSVALSSAGTHTLVGTYSGDGFHAGSSSTGVSQTVNPAPTRITITGASPDPSVVGQPVAISFTIVVTGNGGGTPTGNVVVTVNDGSGDTCTGTLAVGTCDLVLTTAGNNKTITASYVGSADYLPDSDTAKHDVNPFGPVDPVSSTAVVPDGQAGQQTSITIQARDQFGNAITSGGATVSVTISGANSDTAVVTDNGDGTYTATYTPTNTGTDTIDITINSTPIQGSPFSSTIT